MTTETQTLVTQVDDSAPREGTTADFTTGQALLQVRDLKKYFPIKRGVLRKTVGHVQAVDGVSFDIYKGETLGLVGESGCGKTTTGRVIMRAYVPTGGEIWFDDKDHGRINLAEVEEGEMKRLRRNMQMVFQDPYSSLNPRMNLLQNVGEPRGLGIGDRLQRLPAICDKSRSKTGRIALQ